MKKAVLVTGVSKGIGRGIAKKLHSEGFFVYGGYKWSKDYREEEKLAESLSREINDLKLLPYDFADRINTKQLVKDVKDHKLQAIVNNAGEFIPNNWNSFDYNTWNRVIEVNMVAPLIIVEGLKDNLVDGGSVVNISSSDALYAGYESLAYAASKAGLNSLTRSLAGKLADRNIRVNAIVPGWVNTDMAESANVDQLAHDKTPLGRNAKVDEIVDAVSYLISDKASFISGAIIPVDGGYTAVDYVIKKEFEG